jgi:hypothetical protein
MALLIAVLASVLAVTATSAVMLWRRHQSMWWA